MNKFSCLTAIGVMAALAFTSCDDDNNFGDTSIRPKISIVSISSIVSGETYSFEVIDERDSTFLYRQIITDTIFDANGDPVIDENGNLTTVNDTIWLPGDGRINSARVIELSPITKTWTVDDEGTADTLRMYVKSNSRWTLQTATVLSTSGADYSGTNDTRHYYANCNGTSKGSGDGHIDIEMQYYSGNRIYVTQPIMANDSSLIYLFNLHIHGKNYK